MGMCVHGEREQVLNHHEVAALNGAVELTKIHRSEVGGAEAVDEVVSLTLTGHGGDLVAELPQRPGPLRRFNRDAIYPAEAVGEQGTSGHGLEPRAGENHGTGCLRG